MRKIFMMTMMCCVTLIAVVAQQTSKGKLNRTELVQKLRSQKAAERIDAYERLRSDSSVLQNTDVKAALIDLLDRENHNAVNEEDEGYVEYVSGLTGTVTQLIDWRDTHQVCILVRSAYPPDEAIVAHASIAMPCLLQESKSKEGLTRGTAIAILVQVLGTENNQLDPATVKEVQQVILAALTDPADEVRIWTIQALGRFGQEDMIPALKKVADNDPSPDAGYAIRKWAADAVSAIQKRASSAK